MRIMLPRLRIPLVAVAALSTVLVGLCDRLAEARTATGGTCAVEGEAFYGSREDDSGTRSEHIEQDDGEDQDGRDIHLFTGGGGDVDCDPAVRLTAVTPRCRRAELCCRAALTRGPPPAR